MHGILRFCIGNVFRFSKYIGRLVSSFRFDILLSLEFLYFNANCSFDMFMMFKTNRAKTIILSWSFLRAPSAIRSHIGITIIARADQIDTVNVRPVSINIFFNDRLTTMTTLTSPACSAFSFTSRRNVI